MLLDQAHSVATLKHAMNKIQDTVDFLNPYQTPVMAADQPLYALLKQIQWEWPEYGEDICHDVWGTPYRDGSTEVTRNTTRIQWMD